MNKIRAREYQKRKNLEVPPSFKGNSFALLHPDTLLDMTKKVGISIGSNSSSNDTITQLIGEELNRNLQYARDNPVSVLPPDIDIKSDQLPGFDCNNGLVSACSERVLQLTEDASHGRSSRIGFINNVHSAAIS
jgi:hypothetical protein